MEAAGLAFSVTQTLLAALSYPPLQQMFTMWGYRSELESLTSTVSTVSAVLRDAQSVDEEKLSDCERNLIEKLKEAVYDADDLLDEFATLAKQQHQLCMEANEKYLKKVISLSYLLSLYFMLKRTKMVINWDDKVESLSEMEEVLRGCSSSLQFLKVLGCFNLRSVSRGLEHLAALESLELIGLCELRFDEIQEKGEEEEEDDDTGNGMPWRCLAQCLRSLELLGLPEVDELPKGMRYLTALQSLTIVGLPLKGLPEWIGYLPSLHSLEIKGCKHLQSLPEALGNLPSLVTDLS